MNPELTITPNMVVAAVAGHFNLPASQIIGREHGEQIDYARGVAIWLARALTGKTASSIGQFFDWRDEDTILNLAAKIGVLRFQSPSIAAETDHLLLFFGGDVAKFNLATFCRQLLKLHPSARSVSGEQLGLLCSELLRLTEALECPPDEEKKHD